MVSNVSNDRLGKGAVCEMEIVFIMLLVIIILLLLHINSKIPPRDFKQEAIQRAMENDLKNKQNKEL